MSRPVRKHAGATASTPEVSDGICTGRHCVGAGLVVFHRHFTIPLHPTANTPRLWRDRKSA